MSVFQFRSLKEAGSTFLFYAGGQISSFVVAKFRSHSVGQAFNSEPLHDIFLLFSLLSPHSSLVKHVILLMPNTSWQIFDRSLQVFCYCSAFRPTSLTRAFQMSRHGRNHVASKSPCRWRKPGPVWQAHTKSLLFQIVFDPFLFCNWHFSQPVRWSGVPHKLLLALWHAFKLSCQQRQWCCHCRHLNKKCCK